MKGSQDLLERLSRSSKDFGEDTRLTKKYRPPVHEKYRGDVIFNRIFSKSQKSGRPMVFEGVASDDVDVLDVVIANHAELDLTDKDGNTALHLAIARGCWQMANHLLDAGIDLSLANNDGIVPIHMACLVNKRELVTRMLDEGANVNAADNNLTTCLMIAARTGALGLVYILLDHGAEVPLIDVKRLSAVDYARAEGYQPIVEVLTQYVPKKKYTIIPLRQTNAPITKSLLRNIGLNNNRFLPPESKESVVEKKSEKLKIPEEMENLKHVPEVHESEKTNPQAKIKPETRDTILLAEDEIAKSKNDLKRVPESKNKEKIPEAEIKAKATDTIPLTKDDSDLIERHPEFFSCNLDDPPSGVKGFCGKVKQDIKKLYREVDNFQINSPPLIAKDQKGKCKSDECQPGEGSGADERSIAFCNKAKTDLKALWRAVDQFERKVAQLRLENKPTTTVMLHDKAVKGSDLLAQMEDLQSVVQEFKIRVTVENEKITHKKKRLANE